MITHKPAKKMVATLGALLLMILPLGVACGKKTTLPSTTTPPPSNITTASSISVNGLSLSLSLNSASFQAWQEIKIVIDEKNTLSTTNKVPASDNWPLQGLTVGSNGTLNYPMGIAIFQGFYTSADFSSATPLQLYDPSQIYFGPMILAGIDAYVFQPSSNLADVFQKNSDHPVFFAHQMNRDITVTGYWSGSPKATFTSFAPGIYTVFGGDEWGTSVILHFVVSS